MIPAAVDMAARSKSSDMIRFSVLARIGRAVIDPGGKIPHDGLAAAERIGKAVVHPEHMPLAFQLRAYVASHPILQLYVAALKGHFRKSGRLQGRLYILVEIHDMGDELRVRKRLICASHDAESDVLIAAFHECGNNGVKWTLAGREHVGRIGIEKKQRAAIFRWEVTAERTVEVFQRVT